MNSLDHLRLMREVLANARLSDAGSLGHLANQVESLFESIAEPSNPLREAFADLWAALEVAGVQHQEAGTEPKATDLVGFKVLVHKLQAEAGAEVTRCSGQGRPG